MIKQFSAGDITVRPFNTFKNWTVQSVDSSSIDKYGYPTYYNRTREWVTVSGEVTKTYVYKMTDESREQSLGSKPSKSYINDVYSGYGDILPTGQILKAMEEACD